MNEELKHNVQSVKDGGLRLLKKGKRGMIRVIFGRTGLVLLLFFLQVGLLFSVFRWFVGLVPHLFGGAILFTTIMVVYLLNSEMDNSAKITWLVVIALVPVLGVVLFWWTKGEMGHRMLKKRLATLAQQTREKLPQPPGALEALEAAHPDASGLARYLRGPGGGFPVYENTALTYFPSGEAKFEALVAPAGAGRALHLPRILHHRRGADVGQGVGDPGPQGGAGRGRPGDVRRHLRVHEPAPGLPPAAGAAEHCLQGLLPPHPLRLHPLQLPRPPQDRGHRRESRFHRGRESGRRVHQRH